MKKNNLSLWTFSYKKSYYLTHPWKLLRDVRINISNMIHRMRYGYAYSDVWNFFNWWTSVGAEALRYLAVHGCGYPGDDPWETPEKWEKYLEDLADKLYWCGESCNWFEHEENEYKKERNSICAKRRRTGKKQGMLTEWYEPTYDEQEIIEKYWNREKELEELDEQKRAEIFKEIGKVLPRLWD
ncbi:MAG: hypothetical protein J6Y78_16050 [Paludibacteraceae bacterium]|nr:hypothetical protein [Paludibacteraceae bacterium]